MTRISKKQPIEPLVETPFDKLSEFAAHEQKFFAGVRHHKAQIRFQPFEFVLVTYGDFVDKTVLAVHDFVMRKRQYIIFAVCVRQRKRQFVVHSLPEKRIGLDIRQGIVHPTHVPLEIEAQPADVGRHRYHRIRRAFFRNREKSLVRGKQRDVHLLQKLFRFEIVISAEFVRQPFPVLSAIIKIKHARDGVHANSVDMIIRCPEVGGGYQETSDFGLAVVVNLSAPLVMFALPRV